jgi:hypothetical protein
VEGSPAYCTIKTLLLDASTQRGISYSKEGHKDTKDERKKSREESKKIRKKRRRSTSRTHRYG